MKDFFEGLAIMLIATVIVAIPSYAKYAGESLASGGFVLEGILTIVLSFLVIDFATSGNRGKT